MGGEFYIFNFKCKFIVICSSVLPLVENKSSREVFCSNLFSFSLFIIFQHSSPHWIIIFSLLFKSLDVVFYLNKSCNSNNSLCDGREQAGRDLNRVVHLWIFEAGMLVSMWLFLWMVNFMNGITPVRQSGSSWVVFWTLSGLETNRLFRLLPVVLDCLT